MVADAVPRQVTKSEILTGRQHRKFREGWMAFVALPTMNWFGEIRLLLRPHAVALTTYLFSSMRQPHSELRKTRRLFGKLNGSRCSGCRKRPQIDAGKQAAMHLSAHSLISAGKLNDVGCIHETSLGQEAHRPSPLQSISCVLSPTQPLRERARYQLSGLGIASRHCLPSRRR